MFKALAPIIGIIVAVGLFFTYVQPTFKDIRRIQDETASYAQAAEKASELQRRITELKQQQSSIPLAQLERLEAFLPDRLDEVAILIDLDELARTHRLTLGDITVGEQTKNDEGEKSPSQSQPMPAPAPAALSGAPAAPVGAWFPPTQGGGAAQDQYTTLDIGFSVTGTYDDFRAFLKDVERSLVLMEVTKLSFGSSDGDALSFSVTVRVYSLTPPTS